MAKEHQMSIQEFIEVLLSPLREEKLDPYTVITGTPIDPYHEVADIGCGPGYFAIPLAKYLSHGKLYALDGEDEMLDALRTRIQTAKLTNISVVKSTGIDFPLPESSLDGLLLAFVIHQNLDRPTFLKAATDLLKPGAWCCVLEWFRKKTHYGPPLEQRIDPDEMATLARQVGLNTEHWRNVNGKQYMALLRK